MASVLKSPKKLPRIASWNGDINTLLAEIVSWDGFVESAALGGYEYEKFNGHLPFTLVSQHVDEKQPLISNIQC